MHTYRTIHQSTIQIDLGAIEYNCRQVRNHIGVRCGLCAVIKQDGYGLGAIRVASVLGKHVDLLAVYSHDEAGELLAAGVMTPLLILAPVHSIDRFHPIYRGLSSGIVHFVVHGEDHLQSLTALSNRYGMKLNVQVKIDTGLHRGGCELPRSKILIEKIQSDHRFKLTGVLTHFVSSVHDEALTQLQHNRLDQVIQSLSTPLPSNCVVHEANTAATIQWKWTHRNMVRVGLAWTGAVPSGVAHDIDLKPVVSWRSRLAHLRNVDTGEQVGYSGKWTTRRTSVIGIVPVGYAAGFPIGVGAEGNKSGAYVRVFDDRFENILGEAPIVGSVCMDQIAIDLTDIPDRGIGCGIELISSDATSKACLEQTAKMAGVVPHAIISRISPKVHRTYLLPRGLFVETKNEFSQSASMQ